MQDELIDRKAEALVQSLGLPPCPAILTRIMREARADDPDFPRIAQLISHDVSLAAAMLGSVNSAMFGLPQKVASVQAALMLLGLRSATNLVTGLALRQAFPAGNNPLLTRFWAASAKASALAAMVGNETRAVPRDLAHTFALFRDCGMVALAAKDKRYADALKDAPFFGTVALVELEQQVFGVDHPTVGLMLAREWELPEELRWAIRYHHAFAALGAPGNAAEATGLKMIAVGLVADWLTARMNGRQHPEWSEAGPFVEATIGCDEARLEELLENAQALGGA